MKYLFILKKMTEKLNYKQISRDHLPMTGIPSHKIPISLVTSPTFDQVSISSTFFCTRLSYKFWRQKLQSWLVGLKFWLQKFLTKNVRKKRWWNWLQTDQNDFPTITSYDLRFNRCQFHQHLTSSSFVWKCFVQLFSNYSSVL